MCGDCDSAKGTRAAVADQIKPLKIENALLPTLEVWGERTGTRAFDWPSWWQHSPWPPTLAWDNLWSTSCGPGTSPLG